MKITGNLRKSNVFLSESLRKHKAWAHCITNSNPRESKTSAFAAVSAFYHKFLFVHVASFMSWWMDTVLSGAYPDSMSLGSSPPRHTYPHQVSVTAILFLHPLQLLNTSLPEFLTLQVPRLNLKGS